MFYILWSSILVTWSCLYFQKAGTENYALLACMIDNCAAKLQPPKSLGVFSRILLPSYFSHHQPWEFVRVLAPCHASCAVRVTFRATMVAAIKIQVWGWHLAQAVEYKRHFLVPAVAKIPASSGGFLVALKAAASPFCCACSQMCCSRNPCICLAHGMCALPALPYFLSRYIYSL